MGTEGVISRNLIHFKTDLGLKPYPLVVDESDDGDRRVAHKSSQMSDVVESLLVRSAQNSKAIETFETGNFVFWKRRTH